MTAPPIPPRPPEPPSGSHRRPPRSPGASAGPAYDLGGRAAVALREARQALARRIGELDPDLLLELTVGLRGPAGAESAWHDSWHDLFNDNGHFEDLWIDLSGARVSRPGAESRVPETGAEPGSREHGPPK